MFPVAFLTQSRPFLLTLTQYTHFFLVLSSGVHSQKHFGRSTSFQVNVCAVTVSGTSIKKYRAASVESVLGNAVLHCDRPMSRERHVFSGEIWFSPLITLTVTSQMKADSSVELLSQLKLD